MLPAVLAHNGNGLLFRETTGELRGRRSMGWLLFPDVRNRVEGEARNSGEVAFRRRSLLCGANADQDVLGRHLRISCSDLLGIGPIVLEQERGLASELARIGALEQECQEDSAEVRATFESLSNPMQLEPAACWR